MYEKYCWKWLFGISQCKVATSDRWGGQIRDFYVKFSQDSTCQKSSKSVNFWQSYQKIKRETFFGHSVNAITCIQNITLFTITTSPWAIKIMECWENYSQIIRSLPLVTLNLVENLVFSVRWRRWSPLPFCWCQCRRSQLVGTPLPLVKHPAHHCRLIQTGTDY